MLETVMDPVLEPALGLALELELGLGLGLGVGLATAAERRRRWAWVISWLVASGAPPEAGAAPMALGGRQIGRAHV